ncbi:MAG: NAD(P)/FAD-dependent oxidoreductase [Planctomycetota bacterium]
MPDTDWATSMQETESEPRLRLEDGSRIAVIGGGPAGSFFSYFLLEMAKRFGLDVHVDVYEPREFSRPAPQGCNMCGGIISESLVQTLAAEGIDLPGSVVQRGIDAYVLHMDVGSVRIETPLHEKRIGAVYRGGGPRDIKERKWGSFDAHLEGLAAQKGAHVVRERVVACTWEDGRPSVGTRNGSPQVYDLLAVAVGVNSGTLKLFEGVDFGYEPPRSTKTFIREYYLGEEAVGKVLGSAMHVFLLDMPRLEFAAIIPKGDYASVCLLGEEIDDALVQAFLASPEVRRAVPLPWHEDKGSCHCAPRIAVRGAVRPFADRILFVGDCATTRLYKDGIGAAYRTAKAGARTAVFEGISAASFKKHYWPVCRAIGADNAIGKITFAVTRQIQKRRFARRAVLRMTSGEQRREGRQRRMSQALWDLFTGSASYREVFLRTLHPVFLGRLMWHVGASVLARKRSGG